MPLSDAPAQSPKSLPEARQAVLDRLLEATYEFDFFQAVRLLRIAHRRDAEAGSVPAAVSQVQFRAQPRLAFPASEIDQLEFHEGKEHSELHMTVNFMGLTGPQGVLPRPYSVALAQLDPADASSRTAVNLGSAHGADHGEVPRRVYQDDVRAFLDLFNHRMVDLFWQAWRSTQLYLGPEDGRDPLLERLRAIAGLPVDTENRTGTDTAADELVSEQLWMAGFAGLLSKRPVSAQVLSQVLAGCAGAPVSVTPLAQSWERIEPQWQTTLGDRNCGLDGELVLGDLHRSFSRRVRVDIGPLSFQGLQALLPDQPAHAQLHRLTADLLGPDLDVELCLLVEARLAEPSPDGLRFALGTDQARLGWSTWLAAEPGERVSADARFQWTWQDAKDAKETHANQP